MVLSILLTIAGLTLLLFGLKILRDGLEKYSGSYFNLLLQKLTATTINSFATGIAATGLLQSSTAFTVMVLSFVDAGVIGFENALGLILGSNIGSTITPQLLSLPVKDMAVWLLPAGLAGFWVVKTRTKYIFYALAGIGIMFTSLNLLESAMIPLTDTALVQSWLLHLNTNYLQSVAAGMILSASLHSSSAATGVVMVLTEKGWLNMPTSLAFILGANIGTCVTALVVSVFTSPSAQRVALFHVLVNVFGVLVFFPLLNPLAGILYFIGGSLSRQIANAHTIYNILSSLMLLPLLPYASRILKKIRP
ncbi:Na/Pi symporter [Dehalobacter sp. DCM]|uniref:Na/Pi cotransporter family protein n=1 Tax=Dehalobacter sp. DCM TaxID=2907827 RepID=UPI0030821FB2|nr:Na/Pi symporter [Dehalobacter sp. DCM]